MANLSIKLIPKVSDVKSVEDARKILVDITTGNKFTHEGAKRLVSIHKKQTRLAFADKKNPDTGEPWADYAYRTLNDARVKHSVGLKKQKTSLLIRTKALYKSATKPNVKYEPADHNSTIATITMPPDPHYGEFQQFGTSGISRSERSTKVFVNPAKKRVETAFKKSTGIPARPFFAFASDNFSDNQVSKLVDNALEVIFNSISESFTKRSMQLPAEEIEGYESVVSFYTANRSKGKAHAMRYKGRYKQREGYKTLRYLSKSGTRISVKPGSQTRGAMYRNKSMGSLDAMRTFNRRPKMQPRGAPTPQALRAIGYLEKKQKYYLLRKEHIGDRNARYAKAAAEARVTEAARLDLLIQQFSAERAAINTSAGTPLQKIEALRALIAGYKSQFAFQFDNRFDIMYEQTLNRMVAIETIERRKTIREEMRLQLRKEAGYKLPGRPENMQTAEEKAAHQRALKDAYNARRKQGRLTRNEADIAKIQEIYAGARKVILEPRRVRKFYRMAKKENLPVLKQQVATVQAQFAKGNKQITESTTQLHVEEYHKAENRINKIAAAKSKKAEKDRTRSDKVLEQAAKKPKQPKTPKEPKAAAEPKAPKEPAAPKTSKAPVLKVTITGPELTPKELAHNQQLSKQATLLRNQAKLSRASGNTEVATILDQQIEAIAANKKRRTSTIVEANAAQRQTVHMLRRKNKQLNDTYNRLQKLKITARDRRLEARRKLEWDSIKRWDMESERLSKIQKRITSHIALLNQRWSALANTIAPASKPPLGPPVPPKPVVTAVPKAAPKRKANVTAKPKSPPKPKSSKKQP